MVEVVFLVAILGILAASAMPNLNPKRMQINAAERLVVANLRLARTNAITRSVRYQVRFPSTTQMRVERLKEIAGVWSVDPADVKVIELPSAVRVASENVGDSFEFNTRGFAVNLTEPRQIDFADTYGVTRSLVAWPSGQVQ